MLGGGGGLFLGFLETENYEKSNNKLFSFGQVKNYFAILGAPTNLNYLNF